MTIVSDIVTLESSGGQTDYVLSIQEVSENEVHANILREGEMAVANWNVEFFHEGSFIDSVTDSIPKSTGGSNYYFRSEDYSIDYQQGDFIEVLFWTDEFTQNDEVLEVILEAEIGESQSEPTGESEPNIVDISLNQLPDAGDTVYSVEATVTVENQIISGDGYTIRTWVTIQVDETDDWDQQEMVIEPGVQDTASVAYLDMEAHSSYNICAELDGYEQA